MVKAVDPASLSLAGQLQLLLETDLLLSPCGGVSMLAGFLRPGAAAIFIDYWDGRHKESRHMEASVWSHMSHFLARYYTLLPHEVVTPWSFFPWGSSAGAV